MNSNPIDAGAAQEKNTLTSLNDYCLIEIFQHLNLVEVARLSATCQRLQEFATEFVFPKMAKKVTLLFKQKAVYYMEENAIDMMNVTQFFESFGGFVEQLIVRKVYTDRYYVDLAFKNTLLLCPNLKSLHIENVSFTRDDLDTLSYVAASLNELEINDCYGITDDWSGSLERFSKLEHLTVKYLDKITTAFFKKTSNLSTLSITALEELEGTDWETILEQNGKNLKRFELCGAISRDPTLNFDKLPKLETLDLQTLSVQLADSLKKLPHLRSVTIHSAQFNQNNANTLFRKINELGTIENLAIFDILFYSSEGVNAPPLVFNELRSFQADYVS